MLITLENIRKELDSPPLRPLLPPLPKDPFKRLSRILEVFLPPCHHDLSFLATLYAATHYGIIKPREIFLKWANERSLTTKDDPEWDILPSTINWYLPSLPEPKFLQPVIQIINSFNYLRRPVNLDYFFNTLHRLSLNYVRALTTMEVAILQHLIYNEFYTVDDLARLVSQPREVVADALRRLRKTNYVNLFLRLNCQNLNLDELIIFFHRPGVKVTSRFPYYNIPFFGRTVGVQSGLRVPVGSSSVWIQKQIESFSRRTQTRAEIYRVIDFFHIFHPESCSSSFSQWKKQGNYKPYKGSPSITWQPPAIHRQKISLTEYYFLRKKDLGIPVAANLDPTHP
ncbi:MAG: hypothetical protein ACTSW4_05090, partial [Candidatus Ranarchaeia archaeon]